MTKPTPTAIRKLEGNPGKRPLPENEPKFEAEIPRTPPGLTPIAKKHFPKIARKLAKARVITSIDADALAAYCEQFALWYSANQEIVEHGMFVFNGQGVPVQAPAVVISQRASEQMRKYMIEFGMTPSSRTKVAALPDEGGDKDPWSKI